MATRAEKIEILLTTAYDLVAESIAPTRQYDYDARASSLVEQARAALALPRGLPAECGTHEPAPDAAAWTDMRAAVLNDPYHDSDTINWALDIIDSFAPDLDVAVAPAHDGTCCTNGAGMPNCYDPAPSAAPAPGEAAALREERVASGVGLIAKEREFQRAKWGDKHDDEHNDGILAMVACVLATVGTDADASYLGYGGSWGEALYGTVRADRVRALTCAGALIAAEIDRLHRALAAAKGAP
jgi:hypothetical protein